MKNSISILFIILLFQSCTEKISTNNSAIKNVETGFTTQVYIEGDSTWTIEERMEHYGVPGVSIAVINKGKIEWTKTYGIVDKETKSPVTKHTLFQAASISKPVTAYGALSLVEQNKVALNEGINSYLKSWKLAENEFTKEKKVTIKNLLNHSAGITVHGFLGYSTDLPVPTLIEVLNGTTPANSRPSEVYKVPEESFRYSGGGYNIIQQMMIDVEDKEFPEIMNDLVLQPLEMNNSTYNQPLDAEQLTMAATGYLPNGNMVKGKRHTYPEMSPAGLWTTAEDLAKFAINIQETLKGNSDKGLSKEMTTKMLTPFVEDFIGLGIFIDHKKDEIYFEHGGWNEGFSSQLVAHKDKGYGVVVLTNSNHPDFISELIRSVALAYQWDDYVPVHKKMEIEQSFVDEITGRYQGDNITLKVFQKDNLLFTKDILDIEAEELIKVSDSIFVKRNMGNQIQFKSSSDNKMTNIHTLNSDGSIASRFIKMVADKKVAVEYLLEGDYEKALNGYKALIKADSKNPAISEDRLNRLGYRFLGENRDQLAHDILKINMIIYPKSSNVYDSYAEVCLKMGKTDLAIKNYAKSLELNAQNIHAKNMLEELQKNEVK
jgi:CubicO group peptidase (beta-lactamase class C family)